MGLDNRIWQLSLITTALFFLVACDGKVEGDVFIVKGGGDIAVSPGREVTFIPYESEMALLRKASVSASKVALASIELEVGKLCPDAVPIAKAALDRNRSIIEVITQRQSVPTSGCGGLEAKRDSSAESASAVLATQKSERERLAAELDRAESAKSKKIAEIASSLETREKALITTDFRTIRSGYDNGDVTVTIRNGSKYCIGDGSSYARWGATLLGQDGTVKIGNKSIYKSSAEDEFGFSKGKCVLEAGVAISDKISSYMRKLDSPEQKKAAADGRLKTESCGYNNSDTGGVPASIRLDGDISFFEVSKETIGSNVSYAVKPVDWVAMAQESTSFSSYNSAIEQAQSELNAALSRHTQNSSTLAASQADTAYQQCVEDELTLTEANRILSEGQGPYASVESCQGDSSTIASSLASLDTLLRMELDIPNAKEPFSDAFLSNVLNAFSSEDAIVTSTTIQGHYSVEKIPTGNYLVMAEYADNFVNGFWLNPVEIKSGEQLIDLNQNTFVPVSLANYLEVAATSCETCVSGTEPIPGRSELIEATEKQEEALKKLQESLDKFSETMRRLSDM